MGSAMDALKYSNYMGAGLSSLYSSPSSDSLSKMYQSQDPPSSTAGSQEPAKQEYSADSLSRSYLEQQKAYYESAGLKGYGGYGGGVADTKPYSSEPVMSGRQSVESPDLKKAEEPVMVSQAQALQSQQHAALQAYYSQSMGLQGQGAGGQAQGQGAGGVLPPLLPMAAQLSQYAGGAGGTYPAQGAGAGDYSRRPLSVLF